MAAGLELYGSHKDGHEISVEISLGSFEAEGNVLVYCAIRNITQKKEREHLLTVQNWALSSYASAALALGLVHPSESLLLQAICEAITRESIYALAWIGIAEEGPEKKVRIAANLELPLGTVKARIRRGRAGSNRETIRRISSSSPRRAWMLSSSTCNRSPPES